MEGDGAGSIDICDRMPRPLWGGEACLYPGQMQEAPATPRVATRIIPTQLPPVPRRARQVDKPAAFVPPPETRLTRFLAFVEGVDWAKWSKTGSEIIKGLAFLVGAAAFLWMMIIAAHGLSSPNGPACLVVLAITFRLFVAYCERFGPREKPTSQKPATSGLYGEARSANAFEIDAAIRSQGGF